MKKIFLIAALALAVNPAMASKARLSALSNSDHLSDIQDIFANPAKLTEHTDWLTFEFGPTPTTNATAATTPKGEGGFSRSMGDSKYGFYLGHSSAWVTDLRQGTYLAPDNTVNLFYATKAGDMAWGMGIEYSNTDKKSTTEQQSSTGLNVGMKMGALAAGLTVGLANTYKKDSTSTDFKGKTAIALEGNYTMDTLTYSGSYAVNGGKEQVSGADSHNQDKSAFLLGVTNSHKAEGSDFFYGVNFLMSTLTDKVTTVDSKTETTRLPVFMGVEADATSWMVLRASLTQNFILGSTKTTTLGVGQTDTIANDTVVAAGAGLKFGKLMLDATLKAASNDTTAGQVNGNTLLANAALTYNF